MRVSCAAVNHQATADLSQVGAANSGPIFELQDPGYAGEAIRGPLDDIPRELTDEVPRAPTDEAPRGEIDDDPRAPIDDAPRGPTDEASRESTDETFEGSGGACGLGPNDGNNNLGPNGIQCVTSGEILVNGADAKIKKNFASIGPSDEAPRESADEALEE